MILLDTGTEKCYYPTRTLKMQPKCQEAPMKSGASVTIKDVAMRAGVAVSTVSRVINNLDYVSAETRARVLAAAEEMGYVHNAIAASMKTGKSKMIVVVIPDLINDFFSSVVQGVEEIFAQKGYYTLIFLTGENPVKEQELFRGVFGKLVDGAILIPAVDDTHYYSNLPIPVILVDRTLGQIDTVVINNYKGAYLATQELIDHGHKRIAVINGDRNRDFTICTNRYDGFLAAMENASLPVRDDYVRFCPWQQSAGYQAMHELMELEEPPTAVFAANSQLSIGCMNYLRERGLVLGKDVSMVAFDDSLMAQINNPPLTVITRPTIEMGRIAANMLFNLLQGKVNHCHRRMIDVCLTRRESVADLRGMDMEI